MFQRLKTLLVERAKKAYPLSKMFLTTCFFRKRNKKKSFDEIRLYTVECSHFLGYRKQKDKLLFIVLLFFKRKVEF